MPDWETQGCCPCFWSVAKSLPPTPRWKETVGPLPGPASGLRTGGQDLILASSGPEALTLELACFFLILVAFPGLHKPCQVWAFDIKIADLYAQLPTVPPPRPTFLPGRDRSPRSCYLPGTTDSAATRARGIPQSARHLGRGPPYPPRGKVEALPKQLISAHLFTAGQRCLARRMEFKKSSLLTTKQK